MEFKISKDLIVQIEQLIENKADNELEILLSDLHHADIAEVLDELNFDEATYIFRLLESDVTSEILLELEDDLRENILKRLSPKEIAEELDELDTDDAADIIGELSQTKKHEVISELLDVEHAKDIVELLRYDEDTAGGLMGKELVKVNENWSVITCMKEMRIQAEHVSKVHSIYVVDDENRLKGRLSLKDLLTTSTKTQIADVYIPKLNFVNVDTKDVEVARIMQKYDLEAIPVVDELGRLVGRITIDDIIDVIKEEADKDYQLAAGITQDVETNDSILELTKARIPWLLMGMLIELLASQVLDNNQAAFKKYTTLFIFVPLLSATAGNIGVQASAIVVQGLANGTLKEFSRNYFSKEIAVAMISGTIISMILLGYHTIMFGQIQVGIAISISIIVVILFAATLGTLVPLFLHKNKIDPAIATGPFITTTNDVIGIFLYFSIAKLILNF
ncbi:magnesium transporter [Flavobacterium branchiophilum]|uniref:Magnesium transporter MgtE n=2 Tax=Flavobacterium branchiophilum TaxID=55197 RepID=G2Z0Q4_FLABF|nr:magnesium transporter [Flavobacterium branchiophilum]OXA80870.1 magnesium transporter [Flavobacterium branchiophilum] [Flavobacterium branchiophilum NBRC 15030 = ATCC 35035]PDS24240.1 magnesium transporter [Flavobacterium branchiophilum]TQM40403.1 magnesium transporter [Flavobacterium branchiophilum]CCB70996.1 Mg2+ transporter MgtE [Flavobacterium branchiophilum FL-15]GEM54484.1 magnesium transporter MgtE [Flavobacterium branchiophilum NBRC 15030 = ATCC 35035]